MANLNDLLKANANDKAGNYPILRQIGRGERGLRFSVKPGSLNKGTLDATFVGTNGEEVKANASEFTVAPVSDAFARSARRLPASGSSSSGMTSEEVKAAEKELTGKP